MYLIVIETASDPVTFIWIEYNTEAEHKAFLAGYTHSGDHKPIVYEGPASGYHGRLDPA